MGARLTSKKKQGLSGHTRAAWVSACRQTYTYLALKLLTSSHMSLQSRGVCPEVVLRFNGPHPLHFGVPPVAHRERLPVAEQHSTAESRREKQQQRRITYGIGRYFAALHAQGLQLACCHSVQRLPPCCPPLMAQPETSHRGSARFTDYGAYDACPSKMATMATETTLLSAKFV